MAYGIGSNETGAAHVEIRISARLVKICEHASAFAYIGVAQLQLADKRPGCRIST